VARLWCEYAWLGGERVQGGVELDLDGDRIAAVRTGAAAPGSGVERVDGVVLPGLANAHSHAFQRVLRGRTQRTGADSFWAWRELMYELAATLDPDALHRLARAVYAEMAVAGITLVGEFHYLHHAPGGTPYSDPNETGRRMLAAAAEVGLRITLLDTCYLHGGIGEPLRATQLRFGDASAAGWAERVDALLSIDAPTAKVGAAVHSVRAVDPDSIEHVAQWAVERSAPLHAHVSEQPAENTACLDAYDRTPTAVLASVGALGQRFTAVHATHLSDDDVGELGRSGSSICLCPTTERDLADGVGPAARLAGEGARLCVGTDSHAVVDVLEETRAIELDQRLVTRRRGVHPGHELLRAATGGGYHALGWGDAGRIEPGALADLTVVSLDGSRLAGLSADDLVDGVVYAAGADDVAATMVAGRWIVREGRHLAIDVPAALREAIAR
jgi:formiminoglutamate deiminase